MLPGAAVGDRRATRGIDAEQDGTLIGPRRGYVWTGTVRVRHLRLDDAKTVEARDQHGIRLARPERFDSRPSVP